MRLLYITVLLLPILVLAAVAFFVPTWLYVTIFLILLIGLTIYTWRSEDARKAILKFFKGILLDW